MAEVLNPLVFVQSSYKDLLDFPEEVVEDFDGNAYRAVYTVKFEGTVYCLHAFQKKSRPYDVASSVRRRCTQNG